VHQFGIIKTCLISIPEIEKFLLHRLENKFTRGYNTHRFEAENNINLIVRDDIIFGRFHPFVGHEGP